MNRRIFKRVCDIVYENCGIHLKDGKEALVQARLSKRMRKLGIEDFDSYLDYLDNDQTGIELGQMIDVITTNTTSFFREDNSLQLIKNVIEDWIKRGKRKLRIWSAASSTGEEPYTLAIIINSILENHNIMNSDIKILATDISPTALTKAIRGVYDKAKLNNIPGDMRYKYFCRENEDGSECYRVNDKLKKMVVYRQFNLLSDVYPLKGPLDVIFCRNVMIYFDEKTRNTIVRKMYPLIAKGGYFVVGNAESLAGRAADFKLVKPAVYQKIK